MPRPYVGITGFTSRAEVEAVLENVSKRSARAVMVGVLGSQKTLLQNLSDKWPNRYPKKEDIARVFSGHPAALNLIHYNTKEPETLCEQLAAATGLGGPCLHGFQLNVAWPALHQLEVFSATHPFLTVVLQIGSGALERVGGSASELTRRVGEYADFVDYVLIDPSGGYGKPFDVEKAREYLRALSEKDIGIGLGVAGGLSFETIGSLVGPLVTEFPGLSIDAEGRLRDTNDHLDLKLAKFYLSAASLLFGEVGEQEDA